MEKKKKMYIGTHFVEEKSMDSLENCEEMVEYLSLGTNVINSNKGD